MKIVRNILGLVAGLIIGSLVNMGLILLENVVIPPPAGVDPSTVESFARTAHLLQPWHYIGPFFAHAAGTLVGAFAAAMIAATNKKVMALLVGVFFLVGGVYACYLIPAPTWFVVLDIVVAYLPMAWLGWKLGKR